MKPVVLVVLWLWPPSLLAYPTITVLPDEEQNLNHYVQVLQNLIMSVPTREQGSGETSLSPTEVPELKFSRYELIHTPEGVTPENDILIRPFNEEKTTFPTSGFTLGMERKKKTETTAFWSIRPNNVSVVLHEEEPYIEKEEPEPEPEFEEPHPRPLWPPEHESEEEHDLTTSTSPSQTTSTSRIASTSRTTSMSRITVRTSTTSSMDISTDSEDVPQLSGQPETGNLEDLSGHHSETAIHEDILRKISNINVEVQQGPLGDANNPEYKEYIKASREHLKRSLALAAAAEHRLEEMYRSHVFPEERISDSVNDMETVINVLYNSRSRLPEYLNIKHVPSELRKQVTAVTSVLKKLFCADQVETQRLIRKLLSNNMKILNILNVP
ncbi:LOW QUALITY PROTEIN: sperm equatorial segment protein 1 [Onychomys torridus]|uniref:LOW QUALITY PROTEIN: sperm equatorial segment protein 1 n=1 Tax=Onychomys torridus TaxID=38674 RepID=UPI00167F39BB|nr:LOW QUALITY PROTEIN: sperm equatorial segment protein 1 [Onychomys torridus]